MGILDQNLGLQNFRDSYPRLVPILHIQCFFKQFCKLTSTRKKRKLIPLPPIRREGSPEALGDVHPCHTGPQGEEEVGVERQQLEESRPQVERGATVADQLVAQSTQTIEEIITHLPETKRDGPVSEGDQEHMKNRVEGGVCKYNWLLT